jgi:7-carboxy-7-deazaguanine synthase
MDASRSTQESVAGMLQEMKLRDTEKTSEGTYPKSTVLKAKKLPVMEIFGPTFQGEGMMAGRKTHFLRFGGCGYRCSWCDTLYAVLPAQVKAGRKMMTPEEIIGQLKALPAAQWVTLTGGDPAMHDLSELRRALTDGGFFTCIETQGQFWKPWMAYLDVVTLSPKPPSSGMADKIDWEVIAEYSRAERLAVKIVVFDEEDYVWANAVIAKIARDMPTAGLYMTPGTSQQSNETIQHRVELRLKWLFERAARDPDFNHRIKIIPQLHVLSWGDRRGV